MLNELKVIGKGKCHGRMVGVSARHCRVVIASPGGNQPQVHGEQSLESPNAISQFP